ncbi:hypothetical protein N0V90_005017 [Kalmusia sp. IMI 367209]|nr:hypothetical protein N0V90_005017 [Kalmusia sp. IMI 367209]
MRLHDERTYTSLAPIEALKRRSAFWLVYIGDKSLSVLRSMPVTLSSYSFEEGISTEYPVDEQNDLMAGFIAGVRLWQYAADLLLKMRLIKDTARVTQDLPHIPLEVTDHATLSHLYVRFATSLDDLPVHLQLESIIPPANANQTRDKFAPQITDLQTTYHSLKLHLVQKLEEIGYFTLMDAHNDMTMLRTSELAQTMSQFLQTAPFWSLKVNGEPCVEKILLVGASLLTIAQEPSPLTAKARRDFSVLLDILPRLDSRASDALRRDFE